MKRNTLLLLFIATFELLLHAQTTKVEGTLLDESGVPLPGVNIRVQGSNAGTVTDLDGYYSIEAPIGSTLVVSFIGFEDQYIQVGNTEEKAKSHAYKEKFIHLPSVSDGSNMDLYGKHAVSLLGNSSVYKSRYLQKKYSGVSLSNNHGNKNGSLKKYLNRHRLSYSSYITLFEPYRIPQKQQLYTQGHPENGNLTMRDAEKGEFFSWGPSFHDLESDNNQSSINNNGNIVSYNNDKKSPDKYANTFFQTGVSTNHSFSLHSQYAPRINYRLFYNHSDYRDIIPNANTTKDHIDLMLSCSPFKKITLTGAFQSGIKSQNLQSNLSRQQIIEAFYKTPPSFNLDNPDKNGYSMDEANNPNWLSENTTDYQKLKNSQSHLSFKYKFKKNIVLESQFSKNKQLSTHNFSYSPNTMYFDNGRYSTTTDQLTEYLINSKLTIRRPTGYRHDLQGIISYSFFNTHYNKAFMASDSQLEKLDSLKHNHKKNRQTHNTSIIAKWNYDDIIYIDASTTLLKSDNRHESSLHPYFGLAFNIANIRWFRYNVHWLNHLKFSVNYENSLKEVSINFSDKHFQSLLFASDKSLHNFPEDKLITDWLLPEAQNKYDFITSLSMFNNRIYLNYSYYKYITVNVVAPVVRNNQLHFDNLCDFVTTGNEILAGVRYGWWNQHLHLELGYSNSSTLVAKIYSDDWRIPIGGFTNVSNNLIENQPYGVIVGSKYLRNDKNELIIGSDGFPKVDTVPGIIGNPNPDYTISLNGGFSYKGLSFKVAFKYRHGGDVWNGTRASMNYYGISKESGELRTTTNYIFDGVLEDGTKNNIPVAFAPVDKTVYDNRWVRYGNPGVAEDAIEDGSFLQLHKVSISYKWNVRQTTQIRFIRDIELTIYARNLCTWSKYKGSNPTQLFWGSSNSLGIDYYSNPIVRRYGASFKINL